MADVKISADLSEAIEKISDKLGIAANAIIPEYVKQIKLNGFVWIVGGALLVILPWILMPGPFEWEASRSYAINWKGLYNVVRWVILLGLTWSGIAEVLGNIENIVTPKAMAINRVLNQLRK